MKYNISLENSQQRLIFVKYFNVQRLKWVQNFSLGRVMSLSFHVEYDTFVKQVSCNWWRPDNREL